MIARFGLLANLPQSDLGGASQAGEKGVWREGEVPEYAKFVRHGRMRLTKAGDVLPYLRDVFDSRLAFGKPRAGGVLKNRKSGKEKIPVEYVAFLKIPGAYQ